MQIKDIIDWLKSGNYHFCFSGDDSIEVKGFSSLDHYLSGSITWIKKKEKYDKISDTIAVIFAVVQEGLDLDIPNQIITPNSKEIFFSILHHFWGNKPSEGFIGKGTIITGDVTIDSTAYIGYNCSIIGSVSIGAHTVIENDVVIQGKVWIGERCHIQSQSVIGVDGFGYSKDPETGEKTMIEHFGGVKIGDDVFIASHVNIARGTIDDTIISDGVKIAPSTHVGHNNYIGKNATVICSLLYGSCKTGNNAYISASTLQNQTEVGAHTVIGMGSVVTKPIPDNVIAYGIPAKVIKDNKSDL